MAGVQLPFVSALLVLDSEGQRVAVKYWDGSIVGTAPAPAAAAGAPPAGTSPAIAASIAQAAKAQQELNLQMAFEKKVFAKTVRTQRTDGFDVIPEVMLLDSVIIVYKVLSDVILYVVGAQSENELILQSVLQALDETISNLLKGQVSKKTLVENLDLLLLSVDEIIDDGLILETDSNLVVGRVCMVGGGGAGDKDVPLSEQTFSQALQTASNQLVRSFVR